MFDEAYVYDLCLRLTRRALVQDNRSEAVGHAEGGVLLVARRAAVLFVLGVVMPLLLLIAVIAYPFDRRRRFSFLLARMWARMLLAAAGAKVEFRGADRLPEPPAVMLSNHISHMDVPSLLANVKVPLVFLTKSSLYRIPVFGLALKVLGMVPVHRHDPGRRKLALIDAERAVKTGAGAGSYIFFFPEGTRSPDGKLLPFKKGAFVFAKRMGLPLIVVRVSGSNEVLPPKTLKLAPGRIVVEVLDTLYPESFADMDVDALCERVRGMLEGRMGDRRGGEKVA